MERRDVNYIVQRATSGIQRRLEIFESQFDLAFEVWFRRTIGTAADLAGDEQKIAGSDGGRIAVFLVESMSVRRGRFASRLVMSDLVS